jgi:hypothetical protein
MGCWRERRGQPEEGIPVIGLIFHREAAEDSMGRIWRSLPADVGVFSLSATLFVVGAINAA